MSPVFHSISSSSSSSSRTYKVILVFETGWAVDEVEGRYEVFSIDVNPSSDGGQPGVLTNPLFRLPKTYPRSMSFFAFDSKIYFVGGLPESRGSKPRLPRDVFVYDTTSPDNGIEELGRMNHGKYFPLVIGPVNEKFYVISRFLSYHGFEVFDPKSGTWRSLKQPPVPRLSIPTANGEYGIKAHTFVGNQIFLSTPSGIFSYDIVECKWSCFPNVFLPFLGGAVPIADDHFLAFQSMELDTLHYNNSKKVWNDFQCIWKPEEIIAADLWTFPLLLGDGVVCGVVTGNDCSEFECDYTDDKPRKHYVSMGVFGAQPNQVGGLSFKPLFSGTYGDMYDMKNIRRFIVAAFPLNFSHHLESEAEHLEGSVAYLAETSLRRSGRKRKSRC